MVLADQPYTTTSTIIANPKPNFSFTMFLYWADQENFAMVRGFTTTFMVKIVVTIKTKPDES